MTRAENLTIDRDPGGVLGLAATMTTRAGADYIVKCICRSKDGTIAGLRMFDVRADQNNHFSREEVIDLIEANQRVFVENPALRSVGADVEVHEVEDNWWIKTEPNDTPKDNLDGVEDCDGLDECSEALLDEWVRKRIVWKHRRAAARSRSAGGA